MSMVNCYLFPVDCPVSWSSYTTSLISLVHLRQVRLALVHIRPVRLALVHLRQVRLALVHI